MTDLMLALYQFTLAHRMGHLSEDPEYDDFVRCAGLQEQRLRTQLDEAGSQTLDNLLDELRLQHSAEQEVLFRAALTLSRELNGLLQS